MKSERSNQTLDIEPTPEAVAATRFIEVASRALSERGFTQDPEPGHGDIVVATLVRTPGWKPTVFQGVDNMLNRISVMETTGWGDHMDEKSVLYSEPITDEPDNCWFYRFTIEGDKVQLEKSHFKGNPDTSEPQRSQIEVFENATSDVLDTVSNEIEEILTRSE